MGNELTINNLNAWIAKYRVNLAEWKTETDLSRNNKAGQLAVLDVLEQEFDLNE